MERTPTEKIDFARHLDFSQILTNPILDIGARFFDEERYRAFQVCYRSMRRIDDLVDHRKASLDRVTPHEARAMSKMIYDWWEAVITHDSSDPFVNEFLEVLDRFKIPKWPWERFLEAMVYDLEHDGFDDFRTFLRYSEGAAIAPASIFMHLCGVRKVDGEYQPPPYDIRRAARYLALFSYLVHILRDFEKDQKENLNYFAKDQLRRFHLSPGDLIRAAQSGQLTENVRNLVQKYKQYAEHFRRKARLVMDMVTPNLEDRYQLSYEIIYNLYLQIFEMVDPARGSLQSGAVKPDENAIHARINQTIKNFRPV